MVYTAQDDRRLSTFVARVAALQPHEWGQLDAIGARLVDGALIPRWRRAALDASAIGLSRLVSETSATAMAFVGRMTFDASVQVAAAWWWFIDKDPCAEVPDARGPEPATASASEALQERQRRFRPALQEAIRQQPGRRRATDCGHAAEGCLEYGFRALLLRPILLPADFARAYSVVEPVIPLRSLDEERDRTDRRVAT